MIGHRQLQLLEVLRARGRTTRVDLLAAVAPAPWPARDREHYARALARLVARRYVVVVDGTMQLGKVPAQPTRLPPPDAHPLAVRLGVGLYRAWPVSQVPIPYLLRLAGQREYRRRHPDCYRALCFVLVDYFTTQGEAR